MRYLGLMMMFLLAVGCSRGKDSSGNWMMAKTVTSTIASSGTVGTVVDLEDYCIVGLDIPAAFTGTAMTFQCSTDNSDFDALDDADGAAISITVAAGVDNDLGSSAVCGCRYLKPVSGSSEGAERVVTLVLGR